jgi:Putative peptidoglycan binding domain.
MRRLQVRLGGPDVAGWQDFLSSAGLDPGPIDGDFGPKTETATIVFQIANGLPETGIVDDVCLGKAIAAGFKPLATPGASQVVKVRSVKDGVTIFKLSGGEAVFFTADMDVDADGCPLAYAPEDKGIEALSNATNKRTGKLSRDVMVLQRNGNPFVQGTAAPAPGFYISQTALRDNQKASNRPEDPTCYVDALTVPYIVIPSGNVGGAKPGDAALVINLETKAHVKAIVGDVGSANEIGEASIFCAGLARGLNPTQITERLARTPHSVLNPRDGGDKIRRYRYIIFPQKTAMPWPRTLTQIEAQVDGALASLTPDQILVLAQ